MALSNTHTEAVITAVRAAIDYFDTSATAVAEAIGLPQATISRRLNGDPFKVSELGAIADHLGISLQELMNFKAAA